MSSILFSPITFSPLKSTAEYLDDTFFICEPSVFHTTPPQPASNARFTLYFLSVGGALANQYGFGDLIPKKVEVMSAIIFYFMLPTTLTRMNIVASHSCTFCSLLNNCLNHDLGGFFGL